MSQQLDSDLSHEVGIGGFSPELRYSGPIWRFGVVLEPLSVNGVVPRLSYEQAMDIGHFFDHKFTNNTPTFSELYKQSIVKMIEERPPIPNLKDLGMLAEKLDQLSDVSVFYADMELIEPRVRYDLVPVISFPPYVATIGGDKWVICESLTVCAGPALSKIWLVFQPISINGQNLYEKGESVADLSFDEIESLRNSILPFREYRMNHLYNFYTNLLTEQLPRYLLSDCINGGESEDDVPPIRGKKPGFNEFRRKAEFEITGLMGNLFTGDGKHYGDVDPIDKIRRFGLKALRQDYQGAIVPEKEVDVAYILSFADWAETADTRITLTNGNLDWPLLNPKIVQLPVQRNSSEVTHGLILVRKDPTNQLNSTQPERSWYAVLGDKRSVSKVPTTKLDGMTIQPHVPASRALTAYLASTIGRRY